MKTLHTEIGIGAPAEVVWEVISDLDGWADWNPVMKVAGGLAPGNSIRVTIAAPGGKPASFEPEIVDVDDGREFRWRLRKFMGLFDTEHGFRVVPEDVGRCRFENFEAFKGPLGQAMYRRQQKALETGFVAMNRMLKREAEKRARERA
ncbi:MAG: SRPBCC domain-containing protein [Hyphomicrobiaceae bacterium]|nr:SRPBCC domain-containing protein [Hyphomicrobiaceae bacterium]